MDNNQSGVEKDREFIKRILKRPAFVKAVDGDKRKMAIYAVLALLVFSAAGLLWSYTASANQEEEYTTFYYFQEASFDYRIYAMPNRIFEDRVLGPGNAYITSLTDSIAADFEFDYFGESEAELSGSYGVTATLNAYTAQQEHLVWSKEYTLLPTKTFSSSDTDFYFRERIQVPFAEYMVFIEEVREETGFNAAELNLVVTGTVDLEAETADGVVTDSLSPTMIIPMKGSTFTVGGGLVEEREGGITQTRVVPAASVHTGRAVFPAMVAVAAIGLVLIRFLTVPGKAKAKKQKHEVNTILKKHKERIVITANGVASIPDGAITVHDFDELIKLADEVAKPILYPKPGSLEGHDHFFLIYTPEQTYAYGVTKSESEDESS